MNLFLGGFEKIYEKKNLMIFRRNFHFREDGGALRVCLYLTYENLGVGILERKDCSNKKQQK